MGEAIERSTRNSIAASGIRMNYLAELLQRVLTIEKGTDKEMYARLKDIALYADKVDIDIAQPCVFLCILGSLTQFGHHSGIGSCVEERQISSGVETHWSTRSSQLCSNPWDYQMTGRFSTKAIRWFLLSRD
jgi:hypothetical protein